MVASESSDVPCDASRASLLVAIRVAQLFSGHVPALESTSHTGVVEEVNLARDCPPYSCCTQGCPL